MRQMSTLLSIAVFLLTLAGGLNLQAQNGVANLPCTDADFKGLYTSGTLPWDVIAAGEPGTTSVLPAGPNSIVGFLYSGGEGKITMWKDVNTTLSSDSVFTQSTPRDLVAAAASVGSEIEYTVEPDCRMTITTTIPLAQGGTVPLLLNGALANGGREGWVALESPPTLVLLGTLKRAEAYDKQLEAKVDALATELIETKELLKQMARVMGLSPH